MGSSQTTTQNQTQTQTANPTAIADITPIANLAPSIANTPYSNSMNPQVAALSQNQQQGIGLGGQLMNSNPASPYISQAAQYAQMAASPSNILGMTSAYYNPMASSVMAGLQNTYNQQDAQLLGNQAASGAIGGSRSGVANANLANQQGLATGQTMAGLYNQALSAAQTTAGQQAGAAYSLGNLGQESLGTQLSGLNAGLQTGALSQSEQQNILNAQQQSAIQQTLFPQQEAAAGMNIAQGANALGSTTSGTSTSSQPVNYLGQIIGAGTAGVGLFASDERVKENIHPIGTTYDNQPIYKFNYIGDPSPRIGLMAQEVEKKHPDAVKDVNGTKAVDYNKATAKSAEMGDKRLHRDLGGGVGIGSGASGLQGYSGLQNPLQAYQGLQDPLAQATQVHVNTPQAPQFPQLNMGQGQGQNSAQQQQDALAKQYQGLGQALGKTNLGSTLGDWASPLTQTGYANDYGGEIDLPVSAAHGGRIHRDDGGSVTTVAKTMTGPFSSPPYAPSLSSRIIGDNPLENYYYDKADRAEREFRDTRSLAAMNSGKTTPIDSPLHRDDGGSVQQELLGARELQALSGAHSPFEAHVSQPPALGSAFGGRIHRAGGGGTSDDDAAGEDIMDAFPDSGPTGFWSGIRNSLGLPSREGSGPQQPLATPRPLPGPVSQDVVRKEALEAQPNQAPSANPWDTSASAATPPAQPANPDAIGDLIRSHGLTDSPMTQFIKERAAANQPQQPPSLAQPASLTPNAPQTFPSPAVTAAIGSPAQTPPPVATPQQTMPQVNPSYYDSLRSSESGGNPNAQSPTSSAYGPYQFTKATWHDEVVRRHPELGLTDQDRLNPAAQEKAIPVFTQDRQAALIKAGIPPSDTNTKIAHFLGDTGAAQFLGALKANPQTPADSVVSQGALAANHNVFYNEDGTPKTVAEVYASQNARPQPGAGQKQSPLNDPALQPPKPGDSYLDKTLAAFGMGVNKRQDWGDRLMNMGLGMMASGPTVGIRGPAGSLVSALSAAGKGGQFALQQEAQDRNQAIALANAAMNQRAQGANIAHTELNTQKARLPEWKQIGSEEFLDPITMQRAYRTKFGWVDPFTQKVLDENEVAQQGLSSSGPGGESGTPSSSPTPSGGQPKTAQELRQAYAQIDPNATGQEAMEQLAKADPMRARRVGAILRGDFPIPTGRAMDASAKVDFDWADRISNGTVSATTYPTYAAIRQSFAKGQDANNVNSGSRATNHIFEQYRAIPYLGNRTWETWNKNTADLATATDKSYRDAAQAYNTSTEGVSSELAKLFKGVGVTSEEEVKAWKKDANIYAAPDAQYAHIHAAGKLMLGQFEPLAEKWNAAHRNPNTGEYTPGFKPKSPLDFMPADQRDKFTKMMSATEKVDPVWRAVHGEPPKPDQNAITALLQHIKSNPDKEMLDFDAVFGAGTAAEVLERSKRQAAAAQAQ